MKAALVTGASRGIGAATAQLLKADGYFVYLHGRDEKALHRLETELGQSNSVLVADFAKSSEVQSLVAELRERLKKHEHQLKVLVNNAGIYEPQKSTEARIDLWRTQFQTNLFAAVELTEALLPELKAAAPSSVVNVSSTLGLRPVPGVSAYSASKAAMVNWSASLALEMGSEGIHVNTVCPGIVDTPIHGFHSLEAAAKKEALEQMGSMQPLGRIGTPLEVAESILFLASERSKWTTGAVFSVDGGINLK